MNLEPLLIAAVVGASIAGLAVLLGRRRVSGKGAALLGLGVAWLTVLELTLIDNEAEAREAAEPVLDRPIEVVDGGYVGSDTCRACHPHEYETWHASFHRTMTQEPTSETVQAPFDDVRVETEGRAYELSRRGEEFWVSMQLPSPDGGQLTWTSRKITLVTGSHHFQVFWYQRTGARDLAVLPIAYYIADQRWLPEASSFLQPPKELPPERGFWNTSCIRCHATGGKPRRRVPTPDGVDTHVAEFGITCEACHGPGEQHVLANRDPLHRYRQHLGGEADETIVQPERLDAAREAEVCGQCHSIGFLDSNERVKNWNYHGFSYRPGMELESTTFVLQPTEDMAKATVRQMLAKKPTYIIDRFWLDGMVRVTGREYNALIETPCYTHGDESKGILTCVSCHTLHPPADDPRPLEEWANDQLAYRMDTNAACTSCHAEYSADAALAAHSHHAPESAGSSCYNCHMPHTTYGLLTAVRSHQIESPSVATSVEVGRPNACNQCHLDRSLAWTAERLDQWYGIQSPELTDDQRRYAASVLWSLQGDAGLRALMAWNLGWEAADEVTGRHWRVPLLAELLEDPYAAVRHIAYRSLREISGYGDLQFDFVGDLERRRAVSGEVMRRWTREQLPHQAAEGAAVLFDEQGRLDDEAIQRLLEDRDLTEMMLAE